MSIKRIPSIEVKLDKDTNQGDIGFYLGVPYVVEHGDSLRPCAPNCHEEDYEGTEPNLKFRGTVKTWIQGEGHSIPLQATAALDVLQPVYIHNASAAGSPLVTTDVANAVDTDVFGFIAALQIKTGGDYYAYGETTSGTDYLLAEVALATPTAVTADIDPA